MLGWIQEKLQQKQELYPLKENQEKTIVCIDVEEEYTRVFPKSKGAKLEKTRQAYLREVSRG